MELEGENLEGQEENADDSGNQSDKTFTQEQMDALIDKRLQRERAKTTKQFGDYQDLKTKAAKFDELEKAQLTELEKLQKQLADAEKMRGEAEAKATERLLKAEVLVQASKLGFVNPQHAWGLVDVSSLSIDDAGKAQGVEEAVKALATEHAYLIAKTTAPNIDAAKGSGQRATNIVLTADERAIADQLGMPPQEYAAMKQARSIDDYKKLMKPKDK